MTTALSGPSVSVSSRMPASLAPFARTSFGHLRVRWRVLRGAPAPAPQREERRRTHRPPRPEVPGEARPRRSHRPHPAHSTVPTRRRSQDWRSLQGPPSSSVRASRRDSRPRSSRGSRGVPCPGSDARTRPRAVPLRPRGAAPAHRRSSTRSCRERRGRTRPEKPPARVRTPSGSEQRAGCCRCRVHERRRDEPE